MNCVVFKWSARFGHFLKAEANASAPSYPVPPRTAVLGMLGAVLGIPKDLPQTEFGDARIAISGKAERRHWHAANLRKDPPSPLSQMVRKGAAGSSADQRNTIINQEWLVNPSYHVWVCLPGEWHNQLTERIKNQQWHFCPSMGLSEMIAELSFQSCGEAEQLPQGTHRVATVFRRSEGEPDLETAMAERISLQSLRMPRTVDPYRSFGHEAYMREIDGRHAPVNSKHVWRIGQDNVMWL